MKNKKLIGIIGGAVLLVILVVCLIVFIPKGNNTDKDKDKDKGKNNNQIEEKILTEAEMIEAYGFSRKDAEEKVATYFHSDNFEYSTKITKENKYLVTVTDVISGEKFKYEVNPVTHQALEIHDK